MKLRKTKKPCESCERLTTHRTLFSDGVEYPCCLMCESEGVTIETWAK